MQLSRVLNVHVLSKGLMDHFNVIASGLTCHMSFSFLRKLGWQLEVRNLDEEKLNLIKIMIWQVRKEKTYLEPHFPHADTFLTHVLMYTLFISQFSPFAARETPPARDPENTISLSMYLAKLIHSANMLVAHLSMREIAISSEFQKSHTLFISHRNEKTIFIWSEQVWLVWE